MFAFWTECRQVRQVSVARSRLIGESDRGFLGGLDEYRCIEAV